MKKATLLLIAIVYIASIVLVSVFGMRSVVFKEVVMVSEIQCLNTTRDGIEVEEQAGKKIIKVKFEEAANVENLTGTMVQIEWRVLPDNATNKKVKFVYDTNITRATFVKDENGEDLGLILFSGKVMINVKIMANDGSRIYTEIVVWAY